LVRGRSASKLGIDGGEIHVTGAGRPVTSVDESGVLIADLF